LPAEDRIGEILAEGVLLHPLEPGLFSVYPDAESRSFSYDKGFGTLYDRVACNRLYNRLVWGYSIDEYPRMCREALADAPGKWMLDAGCGALAFTAAVYATETSPAVIFLDRSLTLLKKARRRLAQKAGRVPDNFVFLHADALQLPLAPGSVGTVFCLNLLHVVEDFQRALAGLFRAATPGARLFFTTLVRSGRIADRYLNMWANAGELFERTAGELQAAFDEIPAAVDCRLAGNLALLRCRKRD
jgi:ubiquinone/menaquinone biosynthesis C-methylase UbiE